MSQQLSGVDLQAHSLLDRRRERRLFLAACMAGGFAIVDNPRPCLAAQAQTPTTTVDGRKISVEAVESMQSLKPQLQFDMAKAMANPTMQFQGGFNRQFGGGAAGGAGGGNAGGQGDGGGRFGGGGAGGVIGGGGRGFSGPLASYGIALSVAGENNAKAADVHVEIASEVKAVDDNGEMLESPAMAPLQLHFPDFEQRNGGKHFVYLRASKQPRMMLKTLDGELVITPGRNVIVEFTAPIAGKVAKKAFQESFTIDSLQAGPDGIRVSATFPAPKNQAPPPANIQQFMQMSMMPNDKNSYFVELVDDNGDVYYPNSGGSGGGAQMTEFSFKGGPGNNVPGNNFPGNNVPGNKGKQRQAATVPTSRAFDFQPLPQGRSLKAVRMRWIERTGAPRRVPFQLRDIPLPG